MLVRAETDQTLTVPHSLSSSLSVDDHEDHNLNAGRGNETPAIIPPSSKSKISRLYLHTIPWYTCYSLRQIYVTSNISPPPSSSPSKSSSSASHNNQSSSSSSLSSSSSVVYISTPHSRTSANCTLSKIPDGIVAELCYGIAKRNVIRFGHRAMSFEVRMKRCLWVRSSKGFDIEGKRYEWRLNRWVGNDMVLFLVDPKNAGELVDDDDDADGNEEEEGNDRYGNGEEDEGGRVQVEGQVGGEDKIYVEGKTKLYGVPVATLKRVKKNGSFMDSSLRMLTVNTEMVDEVVALATAMAMWQTIRVKKRLQARLFALYAAASN